MNFNIRMLFAILSSKLTIFSLNLFKSGGTTLPGKIAFKIYPEILNKLSSNYRVIMITGTNGKTTTSRIIEQMLISNSFNYISNKSGANLISGITTTLIKDFKICKNNPKKFALLEIDEAAFSKAGKMVQPEFLVVTNFFRDQLDRYGELYTTLNKVKEGILQSPSTTLILNADDSLCASLGKSTENKSLYFSISQNALNIESNLTKNNDAKFCIYCKNEYKYKYTTYAHLGGFYCENCGYSQPHAKNYVAKINSLQDSFSEISMNLNNEEVSAKINLPGIYNIYNALSAVSLGLEIGSSIENIISSLMNFECGFGRMESIKINNKNIKLILVKNPTGFIQVIDYLTSLKQPRTIGFLINDNLADGTDISWLWDVDFEKLTTVEDMVPNFYVSGVRAEDMAVRLKYAGISPEKITIEKDYDSLIYDALNYTQDNSTLYLLPTYTAMLDIRKKLKEKYNLKEFWE